jgi:preprotein translocase subunit SecY
LANTAGNAAATLADATRFGEVRTRLLFLLGALIVYRIGTFIPVPGIDPAEMARFFEDNAGTLLGMANMFSGGALERLSIFAMGVMPYISASIIVQMVSMVYPPWEEYRKEGEAGRVPVVGRRHRAAERRHGQPARLGVPLHRHHHHDHRNHVPDVAR